MRRLWAPAWLLAAACLWAEPLAPDDESRWWHDPGLVRVGSGEMAFHDGRKAAAWSQGLFLVARYNDGDVLMFDLFDFRSALFRRWGIYVLMSDAEGRRRWVTHEFDPDEVRTDPDRLFMSDGRSTVEGDGAAWRIALDFPGFACDLRVRNILPPWRGGDGVDCFTADGRLYLQRILVCPWGEISGWLTCRGERADVRGQVLIERADRVTPLARQYQELHSIRVWGDGPSGDVAPWYVGMVDIIANAAYGGTRIPRLEVARAGTWLFTTEDYTLETTGSQRPPSAPYAAPEVLSIRAEADGYSFRADYRARTLFDVTDLISEVPEALRPLVRLLFTRPVYLRFLGEMDCTLGFPDGHVERFRLCGPYEYVVLR